MSEWGSEFYTNPIFDPYPTYYYGPLTENLRKTSCSDLVDFETVVPETPDLIVHDATLESEQEWSDKNGYSEMVVPETPEYVVHDVDMTDTTPTLDWPGIKCSPEMEKTVPRVIGNSVSIAIVLKKDCVT
ncbi:hypothetical protein OROGR_007576 [Orobanche gracilis]